MANCSAATAGVPLPQLVEADLPRTIEDASLTQAALHLLLTGERDPSLRWVAIDAFPRKTVRVRRQLPSLPSRAAGDA